MIEYRDAAHLTYGCACPLCAPTQPEPVPTEPEEA